MSRLIGEFTRRATRSIWRSSTGSPALSAASGAGTAGSWRSRVATGSGGGGEAERNSSWRPPASMTARWSEGWASTKRPICENGRSNRSSKPWPIRGSRSPCCNASWARRLWPTTRPALSSASRYSGCTSRNCGALDRRKVQSRRWRCRKAAFSMSWAYIFTSCSARCWLSLGCCELSCEMSSTALRRPALSYTGAVVQVRGMWVASKWSSRCTVRAWPVLMQVPTPQVPAWCSLQSAPRYRPALRRLGSNTRSPRKSTVTPRASVSSTT